MRQKLTNFCCPRKHPCWFKMAQWMRTSMRTRRHDRSIMGFRGFTKMNEFDNKEKRNSRTIFSCGAAATRRTRIVTCLSIRITDNLLKKSKLSAKDALISTNHFYRFLSVGTCITPFLRVSAVLKKPKSCTKD